MVNGAGLDDEAFPGTWEAQSSSGNSTTFDADWPKRSSRDENENLWHGALSAPLNRKSDASTKQFALQKIRCPYHAFGRTL